MKIPNEILEVLFNGKQELNKFYLGEQQLDRKIYLKTNEILETIGFKWNKKEKCHIYEGEDYEFIDSIFKEMFASGEITTIKEEIKKFQYFPTPEKVVDYMIELADIKEYDLILEPSAGTGNIIKGLIRKYPAQMFKVFINELDPNKIPELETLKNNSLCVKSVSNSDFLSIPPFCGSNCSNCLNGLNIFCSTVIKYNKIIANPPFSNNSAVKHILHMYDLLSDGGTIVCVAPSNILTKEYKTLTEELKALTPEIIELEEGSFKSSGTMINTCIIILRK